MRSHQTRPRSFGRLLLALAGLLYLLGAAAEPLLHAYTAPGNDRTVALVVEGEREGTGESEPSFPHDESQCLLCKIAGPILAPEGGPVVAYALPHTASIFVLTSRGRAPPELTAFPPRAPPLA